MTEASLDTANPFFPVVGIGASAGGLEAIKQLLKNIPEKSGMAYVYVQHLNPTQESALTEILSKNAKIPVLEITNDVRLEIDKFYIIPSGKMLTAVDGKLKLDPRNEKTMKIKVIDLFFSSLGVVHQSFAVGVVLSGTLDDGTLGLRVIKANGGITFVQDDTAAYDGMPKNAIRNGVADFVLPPDQIVEKLIQINKPFHENDVSPKNRIQNTHWDEDIFLKIISVLRSKKQVDFTHYKQSTIIRRIQRRMALTNSEQPFDYLILLRESPSEQELLFKDMLISVTEFFRDPKTFQVISDTVIPGMFRENTVQEPIRIWVAGCATGEEAYSIAICFEEFLSKHQPGKLMQENKIQIFATDLSETAIAKARTGIYTKEDVKMLSAERLERFFTKLDGNYQVNKSIREYCVFAQHNVLKDPPFSKMNIVSCRNLLIYLEPVLQKKVLSIVHYALKDKGTLVLGKSETIGHSDLFYPYNATERIYAKKWANVDRINVASATSEQAMRNKDKEPLLKSLISDIFKKADEVTLKHVPPGVLVTASFDIIQFRGDTEPWLTPHSGKASFNLLKMAREGLAFELRNILHQAKILNQPVKKEFITMQLAGKHQLVTLEAIPIPDAAEPHYLVLFQNVDSDANLGNAKLPATKGKAALNPLLSRIDYLEKELAQNRKDMRIITEDQEAMNEELQSANEELLSSSEELQALNEELETAKEELQSTNEELTGLNDELIDRLEQLTKSQIFTEGVFATIRDALLILNHEFKITKATAGFYKKFQLTEHKTEGKLLFEILDQRWNIPELKNYLESIAAENSSFADFEITQFFPAIGERTLILNARQLERVGGHKMILLAIEDITDRKKLEQSLAALEITNASLQQSNLELEQFAGIASHDLQEPLRKIITFASIIEEKKLEISGEARAYLAKMVASSKRMRQIISDLLQYSKIADVKQSFLPVDLNDIIKNVIDDFELVIEEKKAEIKVAQLPAILGSPLYLNQLFYNLVGNALKFSRKDKAPVIEIYSDLDSPKNSAKVPGLNMQESYVDIVVRDNGIGFNEKYANQVFNLFERLHRDDEFSGMGLGLAICRKIALQHGGNIYVNSKEGEGSSFHVLFPIIKNE